MNSLIPRKVTVEDFNEHSEECDEIITIGKGIFDDTIYICKRHNIYCCP